MERMFEEIRILEKEIICYIPYIWIFYVINLSHFIIIDQKPSWQFVKHFYFVLCKLDFQNYLIISNIYFTAYLLINYTSNPNISNIDFASKYDVSNISQNLHVVSFPLLKTFSLISLLGNVFLINFLFNQKQYILFLLRTFIVKLFIIRISVFANRILLLREKYEELCVFWLLNKIKVILSNSIK
jgi:hypothetical protein